MPSNMHWFHQLNYRIYMMYKNYKYIRELQLLIKLFLLTNALTSSVSDFKSDLSFSTAAGVYKRMAQNM